MTMTIARSGTLLATAVFLVIGQPALAAGLQINSLGTTNPVAIEHNSVTGDDRGGIAVSANIVVYTGDNSSGRFSKSDLTGGTALGVRYDAITSDIGSGTILSLGSNATTPISNGGGTVSHLLRHDGSTGLLNGTAIALSSPIVLSNSGSVAGIFAGNGAIAVVDGSTRAISQIDTTTGQVTALGTADQTAWNSASQCENWARWGVFEEFGGSRYLTYVQSANQIVRYRIGDGNVTTVASFANPGLSDACSFTVSPSTSRWYVHYEGTGIFRSGDETLAVADMSGTLNASSAFIAVPTLSEWGLVMLSLLAALAAALTMRRKS